MDLNSKRVPNLIRMSRQTNQKWPAFFDGRNLQWQSFHTFFFIRQCSFIVPDFSFVPQYLQCTQSLTYSSSDISHFYDSIFPTFCKAYNGLVPVYCPEFLVLLFDYQSIAALMRAGTQYSLIFHFLIFTILFSFPYVRNIMSWSLTPHKIPLLIP